MLRRRIFASAMASVMALSSVAVVASAEDAEKNVMSKADLQKLIDDTMSMRDDAIYEYGSNSGQDFLDALEYADNVLADAGASLTDYTVAYKMVAATKDALKKHTVDELKNLIEACKKMYESDNILNEELGDLIYDAEKFDAFAAAYEEAERVINSTDSRIITDAYDDLDAKRSIDPLPSVTKAQMRTALKNYEALILRMSDYDSWRRGSVDGWVDVASGNFWVFSKKSYVTFNDILDVVFGSGAFNAGYWGEVVVQGATNIKYNSNYNTCDTSVLEFIREQYEIFDDIKTASRTSNEEIVKAYRAMEDAVAVYNTWSADKTTRATKSSVQKLLDQYHAQMVAKYKKTSAEDLYKALVGATANPNNAKDVVDGDWTDAAHKYYGAIMKNDGDKKKIWVKDGYWDNNPDASEENGYKQVDVAKRVDILKYIQVTSGDITDVNVAAAVAIAELYLAEQWDDDVYGLDEIGTVTVEKGSVAEWTLVYRYLYYALTDTFNGAPDATYTKADVKALIEDCYKLAEETGDSAIFDKEPGKLHTTLVDARQAAQDWVRAATAQKLYKDGENFFDVSTGYEYPNSTEAYKILKGHYDALANELARYKYSYQEIYNYINDVSELIDDGEIKATDDVVAALKNTALKLSTLTPTDTEDNLAFTADREFKAHNRLFTDKDNNNGEEKALQAAYEELVAAVKKQTEAAAVVVGDVNGDGAVTAADATEILKANIGLRDAIDVAVGDVNADGVVNAADATQILKTLIGL